MNVVVLGGTGFVGRHLCAAFVAAGHDVLAIASNRVSDPPSRLLTMDLLALDTAALTVLFVAERTDIVVNATGAVWGVTDDEMARVHVTLVEHVLDAMAAMPGGPRLVQLGSMYEYGPAPRGVAIGEDVPTRPTTWYSQTKLAGSDAVLTAARSGRVDGIVLRVSTAVGSGAPADSLPGRVCAQLLAAAADEPAVVRLTPLRDVRDFVDVRDVADAVVAAATAPVGGRVINIGSGTVVPVRRLVDLLVEASGLDAEVVEVPAAGPSRAGDGLAWQEVDIATARRLLDWTPRRGLEDSAREVWAARLVREGGTR
ncbi:reductase [Longispora fulva]|uniref:dTDP-6-deoxy-L-talose 4-dehydrogenase [NAD(P)+] n=1 Tax=Longispora fulva TaxID=619741 RepID=A0A8J7G9L1_9ACTN|nr:NAD(P)-dependent oxidoreductase [Longispora fulva]MBG6134199.1 dTDP-6-deoxy-L-talose 4-dehydrogenase [NAD(P)+] [Longispora fulva]GIG63091.1 reductase [Longispora fulva]